MIKKITIKNRQCHADTELEFHPFVNAIIGDSDSGKTSILRNLDWIFNNENSAVRYGSYWARKKKKDKLELTDEMSANIEIDEDTTTTRSRDKDNNTYTLLSAGKKQLFEAVGLNVPEEITEALNISEVNFQKQRDKAFLIEEGPTEAAKFLNKTVKLDLIGEVLGRGENSRLKLNREINSLEESITEANGKIKGLSWIDDMETRLNTYTRREKRLNELRETLASLQKAYDDIIEAQIIIDSFPDMTKVEVLIDEYNKIEKAKIESIEQVTYLEDALCKIEAHNEVINNSPDFDKIELLIDELENLENVVVNGKESIELLERAILYNLTIESLKWVDVVEPMINEYETIEDETYNLTASIELMETAIDLNNKIENCDKEINELIASMPDVCPTCGQAIDKCPGEIKHGKL